MSEETEREAEAVEETVVEAASTETPQGFMNATEVTEAETSSRKLSGKKLGIISAAAVVLLALIIGISIYNFPANRLSRQLDLGQKYLIEQNYEQAIVEFDKAIAIDPMGVEAYLGKAEAYVGLEDYESAIETLEAGYQTTGESEEIKRALIENYLAEADRKEKEGAYAESLKKYDRLLELDSGEERIIKGLCGCLEQYLEFLIKEAHYDEAKALIEKYRQIAVNIDFDSILKKIQEAIEYDEFLDRVETLAEQIARLCQAEEYEDVFSLMSEERYKSLIGKISRIKEDSFIRNTDYGDIGIYKIDSVKFGNYMIYYGDYNGKVREGNGVWIGYYNGNNYLAKGTFSGDVPEGKFEIREWHDALDEKVVYRVITGNVEKGLWDGDVLWCFEQQDGSTHTYPVAFDKGYWVVLRYAEDGGAIVSEQSLEEMGVTLQTKDAAALTATHGIAGFAQSE